MNSPDEKNYPLVAVVGPTAGGKSALGVFLAEQLNGEVVVCDSTQIYRRFDIGTGKVTPAERRGVAHHLMDLLEPEEIFTAGEYRRRALVVLEELRARHRLPVFTVGTGLYLRALLEGLADAPQRSEDLRERLRRSAEKRGAGWLHRLLARLDAASAGRIAPRDTPKLIRAIEVCLLSGRPVSEVYRAGRPRLEGFATVKIGLMPPRDALYARIEQRVEAMLAAGWLDEVRARIAEGIPPAAKAFQFIGYRELRAHASGVVTLKQAVKAAKQATRRYAKRQITWFRKESGVRWFEGFGDDSATLGAVLAYLNEHPALHGWPRPAGRAAV